MKSVEVRNGRLLVRMSGRTNVVVTLAGPTTLAVPKGDVTVEQVCCWVDEPREVAALLRRSVSVA